MGKGSNGSARKKRRAARDAADGTAPHPESGVVGGKGDKTTQQGSHMMALSLICNRLLQTYKETGTLTTRSVAEARSQASQQYGLHVIPKVTEVLGALPPHFRDTLAPYLLSKPVRTASGVAVVAVMCKPHRCPHEASTGSNCMYCAGGPDSDFTYSSQSYTGFEPTSMRAIRARYNPRIQASERIAQLQSMGHPTDKIEYVVMGGTFMCLASKYRDTFIAALHDALSGRESRGVEEATSYSEHARHRPVGMTIETRPDYCLPDQRERDIQGFRELMESGRYRPDGLKLYPTLVIRGTTLYRQWYQGKYKGFTTQELISLLAAVFALSPPWLRVFRVMRDIPLPLVSSGADYANLREQALALLRHRYNRPTLEIRAREGGIRQRMDKELDTKRASFQDEREHGRVEEREEEDKEQWRQPDAELRRRDYWAHGGWETFLSYEVVHNDQPPTLLGLLRLRRIPHTDTQTQLPVPTLTPTPPREETVPVSSACPIDRHRPRAGQTPPFGPRDHTRPELRGKVSMVRELHVYGAATSVNSRDGVGRDASGVARVQHSGVGRMLLAEGERISREEHNAEKIAIISGVGVRQYYRKMGYTRDGPYMSKMLV
ncbi:hypothetical protein KIPB_000990 [Kipferlia bialata]|uniref:Elongator complex protein 3 n=1 Tax=Kipferlia bialata TaxID=797122 RepID=A0A9K3CQ09_9EUKA|nr:hypothetical protein KIPB_000990 [Kipferlia bialata]|eukprot:g990.t1